MTDRLIESAASLAPRSAYLALGAVAAVAAALLMPPGLVRLGLLSAGATFAVLALAARVLAAAGRAIDRRVAERMGRFVEGDATPAFTADADGAIRRQNRAAAERFGDRRGQTLARMLGELLASPAALLARLQTRAAGGGIAREDVVTRRGHLRIAAQRLGQGLFLWLVEDLEDRQIAGRGAEAGALPMLTATRTGTVLFMNAAMRELAGARVKSLDRLFPDLPLRPGEDQKVSTAKGVVLARVIEAEGPAGRRDIYILPAEGAAEGQGSTDGAGAGVDAAIVEHLPVALLGIMPDGRIDSANAAARALIGPVEPGIHLSRLLDGLGRSFADWLADAAAGRAEGRAEVLRAVGPAGELFLHVTLTRRPPAAGPGLVAVLSDATQFKTLEAQFVQSQKMQAIGQLAGGVAHDFNNLLTAISGHCDLLLLRHDKGDPDYADLTQIAQNANRAASLVGQLLAFSRKQTLTPRVMDLRDTLADLTHLLNRLVGEKVVLTLSHEPTLRPIRADRRQIEQVIMNLVVNSRDAMPEGGTIRIETANVTLAEPLRRDRATVAPGDYVVVRVIDEGIGIPPDALPKIFEPFFTTKETGEGTGLGLSTAYGIVKQTNGFIFCDSVPGAGTTFTLYFPAHDGTAEEAAAAPAAAEGRERAPLAVPPVRREREGVVLLVEDEAPVRAFASRALRLRGFTVIEAENAEEALRTLADDALDVDVFVTDVIMPGMDGPTWVREALKMRPGARVVFVSGYAEDSFADGKEAIPNSVFLPKPFSLSELTATVQAQLH
ncbi:MAG: ATP-binding protein [Rhodobacteraceae bacterium]|nr:ATP-binding protein [Paracoccaceae bacterium]